MSELLPTLQAEALKKALVQYVSTAVHFSEKHVESAFAGFLEDRENGIFKGPFVRTRLPFAAVGKQPVLDVLPDWFAPYTHQAKAFERLSTSPSLPGEQDGAGLRIPEPTIVTTGTGSGKTESFLYPVLDYAVRARTKGVRGIKAIILYPMNALANDQASRLAQMIHDNPELAGVTAGLYTGEGGAGSSSMTRDHLIEDRYTIRTSVPDILLTNYKMLDQLLLRREDRDLWAESATSLRYLVLDEFHTYNGAQGTDVAMLIRRLQLVLDRASAGRSHMVPVATSATLGDKEDLGAVADFASTVFGGRFSEESVVTETRVSSEELADRAQNALHGTGLEPVEDLGTYEAQQLLEKVQVDAAGQTFKVPEADILVKALLEALWHSPKVREEDLPELLEEQRAQFLFLAHPLVQRLLDATAEATSIDELGATLFGRIGDSRTRALMVVLLIAGLSHARAGGGRNEFPNVEAHLWIREIRRVDRATTSTVAFRWSDDATTVDGSALPAVYCRSCGASGWGTRLTGTDQIKVDPHDIRLSQVRHTGMFRALMFTPQADSDEEGRRSDRLRYLDPESRTLNPERPSETTGDIDLLPVLTWTGLEADSRSNDDDCPVCEASNSVRFVGAATATLLSVSLSSIFGTDRLDSGEKKSLVFTDSVQDAAHRSAFVESRSYALSLRSAVQDALGTDPLTVDDVVAKLMASATTDADRYRLLPATIANNAPISPYWEPEASRAKKIAAQKLVAKRLQMELDLEFGLTSTFGRTLSTTGAAIASVDGRTEDLLRIGREVLDRITERPLSQHEDLFSPEDRQTVRWVRGILERLRLEGAISHEWFEKYRTQGGGRFHIWGGRPHREAMRAFPAGASAPEFPYIGKLPDSLKSGFTDAAGRRGRYARWTARCLGLDTRQAAHLMTPLFETLVKAGFLDEIRVSNSKASARTFGLRRDRVIAARMPEGAETSYLACPRCGNEVTGMQGAVDDLDGAPCFSMGCSGSLHTESRAANYYRDLYEGNMRRVISREHTSLLESELRLEYENQFKSSDATPGAPNVLVATPTLEMGIDIGDLSMVMLSSIPRTVASYLQRVGRAGRRTGNALDLTFASASSNSLTSGLEPTELINGSVRPPAAYLAAEEILHRQFLAFLMDRLAGDDAVPAPGHMRPVLQSADADTFLGAVIRDMRDHAEERLDEFVSSFQVKELPRQGLTTPAIQALKRWALPAPGEQSGLEKSIFSAVQRWTLERDQIRYRLKTIQKRLQELENGPHEPTDSEQEEIAELEGQSELLHSHQAGLEALEDPEERQRDERRLLGQRKRLGREKSEFDHQHWVGALERFGLLPNFTLFDDSVDLDVTLTWRDDVGEMHHLTQNYSRSGFGALTELAPGSHFYAQGLDLIIDTVDLGHNRDNLRTVAFCPHCGHRAEPDTEQDQLLSCPKCSRPGIGDPGQSLHVVDLKKVSSSVDRNLQTIGDSTDDRTKVHYETRLIPNFNDARELSRWSIEGTGIGITYRRNTRLTNLNLGRPMDAGRTITLSGQDERITGFLICPECGHKDDDTGSNRPNEHQGWCSQRHVENPESVSVVLSRDLTTESVVLTLPKSIGEDATGISLWSFGASVMLGLREMFGGEVAHISYTSMTDTARNNSTAILLYDEVPGGTGYLSELAAEDSLREIFLKARQALLECPCASEEKLACHRCLLPYLSAEHRTQAHRGRAVEILTHILAPDEGQDPEAQGNWRSSSEEPTLSADIESNLESRFYRIFRAAAERISDADVNDSMSDGGRGFSVFRNGIVYKYTQQVQLGDVMPDGLISIPGNHGISGAAIFLDGRAFHASKGINRVADDADKRQRLRDRGYLVYAVTHQDLDRFEAALGSHANTPPAPGPLTDLWGKQSINTLRSAKKISEATHQYLSANPVDQLLALFQPDRVDRPFAVQTEVATYLPWALFLKNAVAHLEEDSLAHTAMKALDDPRGIGSQPANGFARLEYPLAIAGILSREEKSGFPFAAVLDDRDKALESDDFEEAWRRWLAVSNLAQPLGPGTRTLQTWISLNNSSESEAQASGNSLFDMIRKAQDPDTAQEPTGTADLAETELRIPVEYERAIDNALDEQEVSVLKAAARRHWPVPEQGEERGGIVVDLAWPDEKVAWIADDASVDDARRLSDYAGWTVVGPGPEAIVTVLDRNPSPTGPGNSAEK